MKFSSVVFTCFIAALLILAPGIDAKRKKNKSSPSAPKSKTKTKWSTTMDTIPGDGANPLLATEEHGYYIKRTFVANDGTVRTNMTDNSGAIKNVPYLAIPIAWFPCPEGDACRNGLSAIYNTGLNALSEGFLCDDDCTEPYEPICGRTPTEVAVFYNKCKLNVAKCRTHGYWTDFPIEECQKSYPKEVEYTDNKFKSSPYFKSKTNQITEIEGNTDIKMINGQDSIQETSDNKDVNNTDNKTSNIDSKKPLNFEIKI